MDKQVPPAQSFALAPMQLVHWRTSFLVPVGSVTLATFFLASTLRRSGLPVSWALLLLLHPAVVLYSRTLMSETLGFSLSRSPCGRPTPRNQSISPLDSPSGCCRRCGPRSSPRRWFWEASPRCAAGRNLT